MFTSQIRTSLLLAYKSKMNVNENAKRITNWLSQATKEATTESEFQEKIYWWTEDEAMPNKNNNKTNQPHQKY